MKNRISTLLTCLFVCAGWFPTAAFADAAIEDGVYYISNLTTEGYLGLGTYHNVDPYIYYVANGSEITEDGWWIVTNTRSGYTFRNRATNQLLVFTYGRVDQYYKYMILADESLGDHSEYWNIIEGDDGAYCIQSAYDTDYYWNLRSGTNMMGTYRGSWGNGGNERYVFHNEDEYAQEPFPEIEHQYVDLDLPSGTLWATCNVGAYNPEDYGFYFAWGETKTKAKYVDGNYKFFSGGQVTKYNATDGMTELLADDDVAVAAYGEGWQTPSKAQWDELLNSSNTTIEWTKVNGVNGKKITSNINGKSIFLPAAGSYTSSLYDTGKEGYYWSRSLNTEQEWEACYMCFDYTDFIGTYNVYRNYGMTVRPVHEPLQKFPSDQYTQFAFPKALHVYLSDGRVEAYPMMYVTNYSEQGEKLVIETNLNWNYTYNLSEVDSVSMQKPEFPTFESFKFNNSYNDQLFTTANGEIVEDSIFVTIACIGKRLTPSFKLSDEDAEVYAGEVLQESKESRLRFDKDVYYLVSKSGYKILTPEADNKYFLKPYGRCVRVHVDWLTDRAEVPTIYINTADGQPITSKEYFKDATITIDGHGIFPSMEETAFQIKGRGNSSWGWSKKPYRLKFEEKVKPLGMTKGKNWVLLANGQTGSLMSNAIGMKAANLMGAAGANHIVPVDLYLNGEYRGSYNLTEKVGFSNNSIDLDDESYAAMLELDSYYDEPDGQKFRSEPYNLPVNIKEPEFDDETKVTYLTLEAIQSSFNSFMSALYRGKDISRYVDIEQLVRFMMVNELTLNYEFYHPKSTFCYRENFSDDESKYIFGPAWDLDWCFGYERYRNYFQNEATNNYWIDMPSMEVVNFIQDLRFKYEPLSEVYRQLWEEFMENDLQELLEYCQDYYDFAHNSFDANKSKWGDNTNYAQQAQQAANWLNVRSQQIYADIVSGKRPDVSEPVEPVEFANDKLYTIECERGALVLSADHTHLTTEQQRLDATDEEFQFAIITLDGQNYIYSPVTKQYLSYYDNGTWVNQLGTPITIDPSVPYKQYLYMMYCNDDYGRTLYFNHNSSVLVINTFSTPDPGNRFSIEEVGDFDPTEAIALATQSMLAVTNRYIFNGEVVGSEVRKVPRGSEPPAPSVSWDNAFVELEEPANMPYQITEDTTIDYQVLWYGPFSFSSPDDDVYWYNMTIRTNYYVGKQDTEPYYPIGDIDEETLSNDEYLWAFSGNPYHVKVYNRSTGFAQTLTPDGEFALMRPGEYEWDLLPNIDGFVLRKAGTENSCINQFGGPGGPLKFWHDGNSLRDNGSTFRIYESILDGINYADTNADTKATKVLQGNKIYILRDGKTYTTSGIEVK